MPNAKDLIDKALQKKRLAPKEEFFNDDKKSSVVSPINFKKIDRRPWDYDINRKVYENKGEKM